VQKKNRPVCAMASATKKKGEEAYRDPTRQCYHKRKAHKLKENPTWVSRNNPWMGKSREKKMLPGVYCWEKKRVKIKKKRTRVEYPGNRAGGRKFRGEGNI